MSGAGEGVALKRKVIARLCGQGLVADWLTRKGQGFQIVWRGKEQRVFYAERDDAYEALSLMRADAIIELTTPPARSYADEDVETQWEIWEGDIMVASSTDEADARHYLAVYSQDGPVRLVKSVTVRTPCDPAQVLSQGGKADV